MKRNPSKEIIEYWLGAIRNESLNESQSYPEMNSNGGKWLIFADIKEIDSLWEKISTATMNGLLGGGSKVSTAKPNDNAKDPNQKVICVYTYDSTDTSDVMRVREELRKLGIVQKIPYKTNQSTRENKYEVNGTQKISLLYI